MAKKTQQVDQSQPWWALLFGMQRIEKDVTRIADAAEGIQKALETLATAGEPFKVPPNWGAAGTNPPAKAAKPEAAPTSERTVRPRTFGEEVLRAKKRHPEKWAKATRKAK